MTAALLNQIRAAETEAQANMPNREDQASADELIMPMPPTPTQALDVDALLAIERGALSSADPS